MHKKRVWQVGVVVIILIMSGGIAYWYVTHKGYDAHIEMYDEYYMYEFNDDERDIHDVVQLFGQEIYWLTTVKTYDVRAMLTRRSSNYTNPNIYNDMWIYIMRDAKSDAFIGFITFCKLSFYKGQFYFGAVTKDFRRKGYMRKLFEFVINKMKGMGITKIDAFTRIENISIQNLCASLNFHEQSRDNVGIRYEKII